MNFFIYLFKYLFLWYVYVKYYYYVWLLRGYLKTQNINKKYENLTWFLYRLKMIKYNLESAFYNLIVLVFF